MIDKLRSEVNGESKGELPEVLSTFLSSIARSLCTAWNKLFGQAAPCGLERLVMAVRSLSEFTVMVLTATRIISDLMRTLHDTLQSLATTLEE